MGFGLEGLVNNILHNILRSVLSSLSFFFMRQVENHSRPILRHSKLLFEFEVVGMSRVDIHKAFLESGEIPSFNPGVNIHSMF